MAAGPVTIGIYNVLGQRIRQLLDSQVESGLHEVVWDGKDEGGHRVSSGLYVVRMRIEDELLRHKIALIE